MADHLSYHAQQDIDNMYRLRELTADLPPYSKDFFRAIEPRTSARTRIAYAYDLNVFFEYLHNNNPSLKGKPISEITLQELEQLTPTDIEEYLDYIKAYSGEKNFHVNKEQGIKRKLCSLKSFYRYYYKKQFIEKNAPSLVDAPKINEKVIVRLDVDEIAMLLDSVEKGDGLTAHQMKYHEHTKVRDLAIMTLLLGTGLRVSECVGLDLNDIDFKNGGLKIHRKGGKEVIIYFGDEVELALLDYLEEREMLIPQTGHENALFLSMQKKRMSVRSIENMVKKYAQTITTLKHITPHKLRSTYGTQLYQETGDIYLVADVLGHSDVNTTRKHYAAMEDQRRRSARNAVRLREKKEDGEDL